MSSSHNKAVRQLLQAVPKEQREFAKRRFLQGQSLVDIAKTTGKSIEELEQTQADITRVLRGGQDERHH